LIDGNKAIATLSGSTVVENGLKKTQREVVILPTNDSLKDLGLRNPEVTTQIKVKDKTSEQFW
jgi:cell division protease FtsH